MGIQGVPTKRIRHINLTNFTPFVHYGGYPPCQSASIPIPRHFSAHGYFGPNIPGCFVSDYKDSFLKGDIVVLRQDAGRKVVIEEIIEVGKHFIIYKVKEVGLIPMGGIWITQLVAPLKSHPSVCLRFLLLIVMVFFPCLFQLYLGSLIGCQEGMRFRVDSVILYQWSRYCWRTFFFIMQTFFISP